MLYIKCMQCRHPISAGQSGMQCRHLILAFQQMYARSPPGPTWKSLKLDWASSISDLSIFEWAHERKLTQTTQWIFSELSQGQAYMYMQCRHGPPTTTNIYAMSPPEPCVAKSVCKVATFLLFLWKVICNVAMWPPSSQSIIIRSHYDAIVILGLRWIASSFVCSVAMRYLLSIELCMQCRHVGGPRSNMQCRHATRFANSTLYAMSPPTLSQLCIYAMSPPNLSQCITDMQCRLLPYIYIYIYIQWCLKDAPNHWISSLYRQNH